MTERGRDGRFELANRDIYFTDGLRKVNRDELRRRAEVVAQQAKRAGSATPRTGLRAINRVRYHLERLELYAVANARAHGWSWAEIGAHLGISKQVLHRRYSTKLPRIRTRHRRDVAGG